MSWQPPLSSARLRNSQSSTHTPLPLFMACAGPNIGATLSLSTLTGNWNTFGYGWQLRHWRHLWSVWFYHIFPHYLLNDQIFGKTFLNIKCVFWFSLQFLPKIFLILRRIQPYTLMNVHWSPSKVLVINFRFEIKFGFSRDNFEKYSNIKFNFKKSVHWKPRCSKRTDRQTDRHMTKLKVAFRKLANAPRKG